MLEAIAENVPFFYPCQAMTEPGNVGILLYNSSIAWRLAKSIFL